MLATIPQPRNEVELVIIGRDQAGQIVATDRIDHPIRAERIARTWQDAGLSVETHPELPRPKPR